MKVTAGSVCQRYGSVDQDPYQNVTDYFWSPFGMCDIEHQLYPSSLLFRYIIYGLFLQIPDEHAEKLITPEHIVKYVSDHEDI